LFIYKIFIIKRRFESRRGSFRS